MKSKKGKLICPQCQRGLAGRYELKRHIETVHEKKRLPCPRCGEDLSRSDAVDRHMEKSCGQNNKRGPKPKDGR